MAAVKNFAGAVAVRFFLGVFEAAVTPGFALFTSQVSKAGVSFEVKKTYHRANGTFKSGIRRKNKGLGRGYGLVSMGLHRSLVA